MLLLVHTVRAADINILVCPKLNILAERTCTVARVMVYHVTAKRSFLDHTNTIVAHHLPCSADLTPCNITVLQNEGSLPFRNNYNVMGVLELLQEGVNL